MSESTNPGRDNGQGDVMASWAVFQDQILSALDGMKRLLAAMRENSCGRPPRRQLAAHPIARKRTVLDFLAWCWSENPEHSYFGPHPQTMESEYRLFGVWRDALPSGEKKRIACEIDTFPEYTACREGARKAFRNRWSALQSARARWVGTDKKGKTPETGGRGMEGG
ncbi:MAG: hypothetical protein J6Y19_10475 [Kiritimatiellae bacterium]|nr:hypothetical protein [Kiritimatiellia bacterium]